MSDTYKRSGVTIWKEDQWNLMISCGLNGGCGAHSENIKFYNLDMFQLYNLEDFNTENYLIYYSIKEKKEMFPLRLIIK